MRKVLHFDSAHEMYECDAAVIACFDNRFELAGRKLLRTLEINYYDPVRIAGGAKALASPADGRERDLVLDQIRLSIRLHKTHTVLLMVHSDCGAYGGLAAFKHDRDVEREHHSRELRKAAACLVENIPGLSTRCFFVDFEGVWEVDATEPERLSA